MRPFYTIDSAEMSASSAIISTRSTLSGYVGSDPLGGERVQSLEKLWAKTFKVKHAVSVNSATSGLLAACMAIGLGHDDEFIVSPYTMSATAAVGKLLGAKPIWCDIDAEDFNLCPIDVSNKITRRTKAVIVTSLFGHPARLAELRYICDSHGIPLIEDNAQSIFATEGGAFAGTIGHMGVFSLNVHKQLQVGEGGVITTNDYTLDKKLREAMNHGEMRGGIVGLNLRMTEITAAMALEQLLKSSDIMASRRHLWEQLSIEVLEQKLPIIPPTIRAGCTHAAYAWAGQLTIKNYPAISPPFKKGYMKPLYSLPAFKGSACAAQCPTCESVEEKMIIFECCARDYSDEEVKMIVKDLGECL